MLIILWILIKATQEKNSYKEIIKSLKNNTTWNHKWNAQVLRSKTRINEIIRDVLMRVINDRCMPEILNFELIITILKETKQVRSLKQYYDKSKVIVTDKSNNKAPKLFLSILVSNKEAISLLYENQLIKW